MSQNPGSNIDESASRLLEQLTALRQANAESPESDRREAFQRALDQELAGQPGDAAKRVIAAVRERLIAQARERDSRLAGFEAELTQLRGQLESVQTERDRLDLEVRQVKAESVAATPGASISSDTTQRIREALFKGSQGEKVDPETIDLPPNDARLLGLLQELLSFTLLYEQSVNVLLQSLQIGPGMDTQQIKGMKEEVRDRFRSCLENKEGSVKALQAALEKKKSFLIDLNQAYQASLHEGTRTVLAQLDPQPIAEAHRKPIIGVDHGEAWKSLGRAQNDLVSASKNELWERFFLEPFRSKLARHLDPSGD
jgi:hypothetical protein